LRNLKLIPLRIDLLGMQWKLTGTFFDFFQRKIMIRKLKSGQYLIYSIKKDPKTGKRRNLGTFSSLAAAKKHEKDIQYFKHH